MAPCPPFNPSSVTIFPRSSLLNDSDAARDAVLVREVSGRLITWTHDRLCDAHAHFGQQGGLQPQALAVREESAGGSMKRLWEYSLIRDGLTLARAD